MYYQNLSKMSWKRIKNKTMIIHSNFMTMMLLKNIYTIIRMKR